MQTTNKNMNAHKTMKVAKNYLLDTAIYEWFFKLTAMGSRESTFGPIVTAKVEQKVWWRLSFKVSIHKLIKSI